MNETRKAHHDEAEEAAHHGGTKRASQEPKAEDFKPVLPEGTGGASPVVRFEIDGQVKSLSRPVRGTDLYRVAGDPKSLKVGGKAISNDTEIVDVPDDAEVAITR
jgi:hypothetical protein